jgi:hypothetical protein
VFVIVGLREVGRLWVRRRRPSDLKSVSGWAYSRHFLVVEDELITTARRERE